MNVRDTGCRWFPRLARVCLLALLAAAAVGAGPPRPPRREIDNIRAFARLYGVVRYFYPSDVAATLDWNRLAVSGVGRVREARDAAALTDALQALFGPLGPGIQIGRVLPAPAPVPRLDTALVAWRYLGPALGDTRGPYKTKRTHRPPLTPIEGGATLKQTLAVAPLQGRTIRLRGQARAVAQRGTGVAGLSLAVDRPGSARGLRDYRAVRGPGWRDYVIEAAVANDATEVAIAVSASGPVTADFDGLTVAVQDTSGGWVTVPIDDGGFEAPVDAAPGAWVRLGTAGNARITRPAGQAPEGRQFLRLEPPPPMDPDMELFDGAAPAAVTYAQFDLGSGLAARVPLALTDAEARWERPQDEADDSGRAANPPGAAGGMPDLDTRLADVVVAWNAFRHFYPYWDEAGVDWDARLPVQLEAAYQAPTRAAHRDALRALAADARDGHGAVRDVFVPAAPAALPVQLALVEGQVVIVASASVEAPVGAIVREIDGAPARQRLAEQSRLCSGTDQWKQAHTLEELTIGTREATTRWVIDHGSGRREVTLRYQATQLLHEDRPQAVADLEPGIWYVDLTRARMDALTPRLETLARAHGVVFDVRGYPTEAGKAILAHLIDAPERDRWMHVAKLVGPFGQSVGWQNEGWNLEPARPRLAGRIVFLTDGRAISYAESVMGYVADRKLGTIIGAPTAGTNGDVTSFLVPGGFRVSFTGLRVTGHDGRTPHHLVGIKPDIPLAPTLAGLRSGRDELLERAVATIRAAAP